MGKSDDLRHALDEQQQLEAALRRERERADAERARADLAEASARRAWQMASWGGRRPHTEG